MGSEFAQQSVALALEHRDCRLFIAGRAVPLIGTWATRTATSWLIYRISGSAWMLGLVAFLGQLPAFASSPMAGVWDSSRFWTLGASFALVAPSLAWARWLLGPCRRAGMGGAWPRVCVTGCATIVQTRCGRRLVCAAMAGAARVLDAVLRADGELASRTQRRLSGVHESADRRGRPQALHIFGACVLRGRLRGGQLP